MALKRLDEEFELKPGTQLLPYMKRLLPSLEGRFQELEQAQDAIGEVTAEIRAAALLRMNEILIPATEDIVEVTKLGFLLGPSSTPITLELGLKYFYIDEGPQRDTFTPSPYVIVERKDNIDDYAIARMLDYVQETGELALQITAFHGDPGPHSDWVISSTPGMADSTKLYHDAIAPMHDTVVADTAEVVTMHAEILAAAQALAESGLDVNAFIRRDGTVPFITTQTAIAPVPGSNDATIVTSQWVRARIIEYTATAVSRSGDTMQGPLSLSGLPSQPAHAASKAYVDSIIGQGGIINNSVTLRAVSPYLRLQSTGSAQNRSIEGVSPSGVQRWLLMVGDTAGETGGNAGSNFSLYRYTDLGAYIDNPLWISRQSGAMTTKTINCTGGIVVTGGDSTVAGDLHVYRPGSPTTGVLYLNQANTAYHHFDGSNHVLAGGGLTTYGNAVSCGNISCGSISTNGNPITCWGFTSHGTSTINGYLYQNGNMRLYGQGANYLEFYDSDWGPMSIHHNGDLIGYLNNGGGWIEYTTNAGHKWIAQYGWLHDYVNGRASAYAWDAANYRYNQTIQQFRMAYAGDWGLEDHYNMAGGTGVCEPHGNSAITGIGVSFYYTAYIWAVRYRQNQAYRPDWGGWYAVAVA